MQILEAQTTNFTKYRDTSLARGTDKTFIRLTEEVGEVAKAMRNNSLPNLEEEIADVLAWTLTLASLFNIDAEVAYIKKYGSPQCFRCHQTLCICPEERIKS